MEKLENFRDKRVLVTGATGFKASWLSVWLNKLGAHVYGFSLEPPSRPNMYYDGLELNKVIQNQYGDVRDKVRLDAVVEFIQPAYVFHLAAQPIVKTSYENPQLTFETNTIGTLNLLEACKKVESIESIVVVTSDKVYKNIYPYEYTELSELGTNGDSDPYSASKACAELVVDCYRKIFHEKGVALATVRAGNVIGGGDWGANRLIPDITRSIVAGEQLSIYSPEAVRPWQYVLDCLYGYMSVAALHRNESWNFGPKSLNCITVEDMVKRYMKAWGCGTYTVVPKSFRESPCLKLKIDKAKKELYWAPQYNVDKIIERTVHWYKTFYEDPKHLMQVTLKEIEEYESLIK